MQQYKRVKSSTTFFKAILWRVETREAANHYNLLIMEIKWRNHVILSSYLWEEKFLRQFLMLLIIPVGLLLMRLNLLIVAEDRRKRRSGGKQSITIHGLQTRAKLTLSWNIRVLTLISYQWSETTASIETQTESIEKTGSVPEEAIIDLHDAQWSEGKLLGPCDPNPPRTGDSCWGTDSLRSPEPPSLPEIPVDLRTIALDPAAAIENRARLRRERREGRDRDREATIEARNGECKGRRNELI